MALDKWVNLYNFYFILSFPKICIILHLLRVKKAFRLFIIPKSRETETVNW